MSAEWGYSRRTATRDCDCALGELQFGLDIHDLAHLISHLATTLQRVSLKTEMSGQQASAIGAQRLLPDYWCLAGWRLMRKSSAQRKVVKAE